MSPATVHVNSPLATASDAAEVRLALVKAMAQLGIADSTEVAVVLTDDSELRGLNSTYRQIDAPTDVLSFPAGKSHSIVNESPYLGDILISVEAAQRSAAAGRVQLVDELRLLAVHGLLHLMGYQDETDEGADQMYDMEVELGVRRDALDT